MRKKSPLGKEFTYDGLPGHERYKKKFLQLLSFKKKDRAAHPAKGPSYLRKALDLAAVVRAVDKEKT